MRFEVSPKLFELLPDAVFGVVAVRGADNSREYPEISALLRSAAADCASARSRPWSSARAVSRARRG